MRFILMDLKWSTGKNKSYIYMIRVLFFWGGWWGLGGWGMSDGVRVVKEKDHVYIKRLRTGDVRKLPRENSLGSAHRRAWHAWGMTRRDAQAATSHPPHTHTSHPFPQSPLTLHHPTHSLTPALPHHPHRLHPERRRRALLTRLLHHGRGRWGGTDKYGMGEEAKEGDIQRR